MMMDEVESQPLWSSVREYLLNINSKLINYLAHAADSAGGQLIKEWLLWVWLQLAIGTGHSRHTS